MARPSSISAALIGAAATIIAAIIAGVFGLIHFGPNIDSRFPVAVFDSASGNAAVPDADVSLSLPEFTSEQTDSGGKHVFQLSKRVIGKSALLTVSKSGYVEYKEQIADLEPRDDYHRVYLKRPLEPAIATPVPSPVQPAQLVRTYSSGPKPSGSGSNFSGWIPVCSSDAPAGYHIEAVDFKLGGDRSCGAWSECAVLNQTPTQVCWQFRTQGHSEWPPPGQASSDGSLTVTWKKD